jgi:hypothetical protein
MLLMEGNCEILGNSHSRPFFSTFDPMPKTLDTMFANDSDIEVFTISLVIKFYL